MTPDELARGYAIRYWTDADDSFIHVSRGANRPRGPDDVDPPRGPPGPPSRSRSAGAMSSTAARVDGRGGPALRRR